MSVALLIIRDGRDEVHRRAIWSLNRSIRSRFFRVVTVDDREHDLGFAGAIAQGWREVLATGAEWVFHFEADFMFRHAVSLERMLSVMREHPDLVQLSLKRGPANPVEAEAGGFVELRPDDYTEKRNGRGDVWTEHRCFFTTNPSLYRASLCERGWPQESESEGKFGLAIREDPAARFAFWGAKLDPPLIEHIGTTRAGHGY